ncbi:MAG: YkvA family protein, partial [candidate division NC10 bacterium]
KDLLLLLPRLARMIASLLADRQVPMAAKVALAAVAVYLASPVDLIPDFIPFLGYLDDALLVAVVVDGLLNYLDRSLLLKYWPGGVASLDATAAVARRLARWVPARLKARIFAGR